MRFWNFSFPAISYLGIFPQIFWIWVFSDFTIWNLDVISFSTILNMGISLILKYEIWEFSISFSAILNLGISLILQFMIGVLIFSNYFKFWIFLYFQNWRFSFSNVLNLGISLLVFGIWGIFVFQPLDIWVFPWYYNLRFGRFSFSNILYFSDFVVWVYFLLF